ncbi:MAG: phage holin family protein [Firmicutes bacterium]|nr:phage holin family protein [Bacillota bacterium]
MVRFLIRLVVSAIVLLVVQWLIPGFRLFGLLNALLAAVVIAVLGYIAETLLGKRISPQSRGVVGFVTAAVVIYLAQYFVPTMRVSVFGALLASLIIGVIDSIVPTEIR